METTTTEKQGRGQLTTKVKELSQLLLGYEMDVRELRLMPYIQYTLLNSQKLNPGSVNSEEKEILAKWLKMGYITSGITPKFGRPKMNEHLRVTKEFWGIISQILFVSYVDTYIETL